jgi:hypothetical protein
MNRLKWLLGLIGGGTLLSIAGYAYLLALTGQYDTGIWLVEKPGLRELTVVPRLPGPAPNMPGPVPNNCKAQGLIYKGCERQSDWKPARINFHNATFLPPAVAVFDIVLQGHKASTAHLSSPLTLIADDWPGQSTDNGVAEATPSGRIYPHVLGNFEVAWDNCGCYVHK